uniref:RNA transcription, translation and transport factor protein n=1 Tax=Amphiprion percula TaxID=161767 RepID=A0A3P8TNV1_AMPPE
MFRRKLTALDYHNPNGFDCTDETQFRNCIVWLEDQKIRHYKIEDRGNLRNIPSSDWPQAYQKYLQDVSCPFGVQERQEAVDWLLGLAVRYEYGDNVEKYKNCQPLAASSNSDKAVDPLVNLDSNSPDFKAGVTALANILKIQRHDDYLVMLKAIRILIQERLSPEAITKANQNKEVINTSTVIRSDVLITAKNKRGSGFSQADNVSLSGFNLSCLFSFSLQGIPVALDKHILGFDTGDASLNEAAQILRLLHIEELRELQTKINEAIVAVQAIIADPKTDHRLGKVGR